MKMLDMSTVQAINRAVYFRADRKQEKKEMRPWQFVRMEYERVGMTPPASLPDFDSIEDAQIWMCLDGRFNVRLRESSWAIAG